jgi:broad specificity phosphatase PhoE
MNIFLVRHGQKERNLSDPGLTDLGKKQAREVGNFLKDISFDSILTSPFKRTLETADEIISVIDGKYEVNDSLVERMEWVEGVDMEEFLNEWTKATVNRDYQPKDGDSSRKAGERIQSVIDSFNTDVENVLLVTHGGVIVDFLRSLFGDEGVKELRKEYKLGYGYEMLNCSINKIVVSDENRIEMLNDTKHLSNPTEF